MAAASPPGQGMNNLTTLIKRLEAATSRLEDIAASTASFDTNAAQLQAPSTNLQGSKSVPDLSGSAPDSLGSNGIESASPKAPAVPEKIADMDVLIGQEVEAFVASSKGLDPLVEEQASSVAKAFRDQRRFLLASTRAKKPDMSSPAFPKLIQDLQQDMSLVGDVRDGNRGSPMKEHLAMVGEGISALQWLVMDGKPADFVGEVLGGAQMYGNRVLKAYKESDQAHVKYVQAYYALLKALQAYIKKQYPAGVTWDNNGIDAVQAYEEADSSAPQTNGVSSSSAGGGPPPPTPPPPLPTFDNAPPPPPPPPGAPSASAGGPGDMDAMFAQLNRGEDVTKGLKKVDKSQMTHKNPALRSASTVPDSGVTRSGSRGPETKPKPASMRQNSSASMTPPKKASKKELDGNKWLVENFDSPSAPITLEVSNTQSILISGCKNTTIILRGKANAISIDNSPRTQILVETLISSIDVIKSPNFAVQITGTLPTIMLDQVDGASIYLGKDSLATEVFTSKCSSVNIVLPPEGEQDDSKECPLPEQIRTFIKDGKLISEIVEHAG